MTEPTSPLGAEYPAEPTVEMRAVAITCRQLYAAMTDEGFTERQALGIIGAFIAGGSK